MGWDNPPVPWRELERRLSWGTSAHRATGGERAAGPRPRPVTRLPAAGRASPAGEGPAGQGAPGPAWAELHCHSSYSFLDGACAPAELITEAARLGLTALAITDHDGMYGVPQFAQAAAKLGEQAGIVLGTVFGAELSVAAGPRSARADPRAGSPDPAGQH
ncbi:MAG TPA: PHP domain-containing protein, partial [Streptosporangiaceae bacterium]|nr:PHP domain-containing protein [Streptosporangiaceae bacterium]